MIHARTFLLALVASLAVALVPASSAQAAFKFFKAPSKNIFCGYDTRGTSVRCDILRYDAGSPGPKRPSRCEGDFGGAFSVSQNGSKGAALCVGDTVADPDAPTLAYGKSRRIGKRITCTSSTRFLRCVNTRGHGFELSRTARRVF